MAAVLGVEDMPLYPRLPLEVGSCEQGARCCWRWLARAALEEVAGEPMGHDAMAEMVAKLRTEVIAASELRVWATGAEKELEKTADYKRERDNLQANMQEMQQELKELRAKEAEFTKAFVEVEKLQEELAEVRRSEGQLQRQLTALRAQKQVLIEGDLVAAKKRADIAEQEIAASFRSREEMRVSCDDLRGKLEKAELELAEERSTTLRLGQELDEALNRKKKRAGPKRKAKGAKPGLRR